MEIALYIQSKHKILNKPNENNTNCTLLNDVAWKLSASSFDILFSKENKPTENECNKLKTIISFGQYEDLFCVCLLFSIQSIKFVAILLSQNFV